ncbi:MAG: DUF420 domain-containing protein [Phycisphaerae bacterium]
MHTSDLPAVNATLNALAAVLLTAGFVFIRRKQIQNHKRCMIAAFAVSCLFLILYVTYHALHGSTRFTHPGPVRYVYFFVLITHVSAAVVNIPMVLVTLTRALRNRVDAHKRIARWTWPLWMYVSVTGVIVYLMLYQCFPAR